MTTTYWLEDPGALLRANADGSFIPSEHISGHDMENSIARLVLIIGALFALETKSTWPLILSGAALGVRHMGYKQETAQKQVIQRPVLPFVNPAAYVTAISQDVTKTPEKQEFVPEPIFEQDLQAGASGEMDRTYAVAKPNEDTPAAIYWGAEDDPMELKERPEGPFTTRFERGEHMPIVGEGPGTIEQL